jgi:Predicted integral membrane protein (DUF2269)
MYHIALFLHILGVLCLMGGHTLVHTTLEVMRRAQTVESIRNWAAIAAGLDTYMPAFTLAIVLPGLYMAWTTWGWTTAWIDGSLGVFGLLMILGPTVLGRRLAALNREVKAAPSGKIPESFATQIADRGLWTIENTFTSLLLAILFLMTVKPNLLGTAVVLGIGLVVGLLSTVRMARMVPSVAVSASQRAQKER